MIKLASQILDSIGKWMSDNPTAATALLTGGAGALGGLALTKTDPEEDTSSAMLRRLKNALLVGGLSAGAGALGAEAFKNFGSAVPDPGPAGPVGKTINGGIIAAAGGAGGYGGFTAANRLFNSELSGIGDGAKIRNLAQSLDPKFDGKSIARARDIIQTNLRQNRGAMKIITSLAKNGDTASIAELGKMLGGMGFSGKGVPLETLANNMKWFKSPKAIVKGGVKGLAAGGAAVGASMLADYLSDLFSN